MKQNIHASKINKLLLSFFAMLLLPIMTQAQNPVTTAWMMSTSGSSTYQYYQGPPTNPLTMTLQDSSDILQVCTTATEVYVRSNGLASYSMGPWLMNPNVPMAQNNTYKFPLTPQQETGTKTGTPFGGPLGLTVNGINMYGYGDARSYSAAQGANVNNGDGNWDADAWVSEGATMDASGNGHADGQGNYHYHANPKTLYADPSTSHSPIIGFAFDGYPIYGPFGYSTAMDSTSGISRMTSSYQLRNITLRDILPNGQTSVPAGPAVGGSFPLGTYIQDYEYVNASGSLDEFNGRMCRTPEYPNGTYAYFITTESNGDPRFPYVMASEYYGQVAANAIGPQAGNNSIPTNAVCGSFAVGIDQLEHTAAALIVYPNPTEDMISVELEAIGAYHIQLVDVLGAVVLSETRMVQGVTDLSLKNLNPGIYVIQFSNTDTGKTFVNKVLKK